MNIIDLMRMFVNRLMKFWQSMNLNNQSYGMEIK